MLEEELLREELREFLEDGQREFLEGVIQRELIEELRGIEGELTEDRLDGGLREVIEGVEEIEEL